MNPQLAYGLTGYLEDGEVPYNIDPSVQKLVKKIANHYIINNKQLMRIDSKQDTHGGRQQLTYRTVINTHEKIPLLRKVHDDPTGGHLGQENTYSRLSKSYYWPRMQQDIIDYVRTCKICQKRQRRRGETPLQPIKKGTLPFHQVGIDVMGPLPRTLT